MNSGRMKYLAVLLLIVCVTAGVLSWRTRQSTTGSSKSTLTAKPAAVIQSDWRAGVTRVLAEYDQTQDAKAAVDGLLALYVTQGDQPVHLELVVAFQSLSESRSEAKEMLRTARSHFEGGETVVR